MKKIFFMAFAIFVILILAGSVLINAYSLRPAQTKNAKLKDIKNVVPLKSKELKARAGKIPSQTRNIAKQSKMTAKALAITAKQSKSYLKTNKRK